MLISPISSAMPFRIFHPYASHMHLLDLLCQQQFHISHPGIFPSGYLYPLLHSEIPGLQPLGSQTLWIHLHVVYHRLQLPAP